MDDANGLKETARVTASIGSNTLGVNVYTAPRLLSPVTKSLARLTLPRRSRTPSVTCRTSIGLQKTATTDQELFDQMTALYPHWVANQSWLMFGLTGA